MQSIPTPAEQILSLMQQAPAVSCSNALRESVEQALQSCSAQPDAMQLRLPVALQQETLAALALLGLDGEVAVAALLRDAPALMDVWMQQSVAQFPSVVVLLEGQQAAAQVWSLHAQQQRQEPEGLRRLLLAIVRDLRVVPILLARQLARMRHMDVFSAEDQQAIAQLTRDIHAPLANRLGIWQLKWELEDLAFRYLQPDTYREIARLLDEKRSERERHIALVKQQLQQALQQHGISADVAGRPKHIYSIYKKMQRKNAPIGELYDLRAVRVMVDDVAACYAALGVVHSTWTPIPSEFDDYIARPKRNDYRSLHTAVIGPEGKTVEVQIRTRQMHAQAELGVAAHWRYKEGKSAPGGAAVDRKIEWMRSLLEGGEGEDVRAALQGELQEERVYVLTPKGQVLDLPQGATPLDFAYHVHTDVGHRFRGAKVDGRIVPAEYVLRTGERVEIMTGKESAPRRDWLVQANGYLASSRSRDKVRAWFNKVERAANIEAGREMMEKEQRRLGLLQADLSSVCARFHVDSVDDLYVQIALGDIGSQQVARALLELQTQADAQTQTSTSDTVADAISLPRGRIPKAREEGFIVQGLDNVLTHLAKCCEPVAGEAVTGYLTQGRGVSIHRAQCPTVQRLIAQQPQRQMSVQWGSDVRHQDTRILISGSARKTLLKDITNVIAQENAHILDIRGESSAQLQVRVQLRVRVADVEQLARLLAKLEMIAGVEFARRA